MDIALAFLGLGFLALSAIGLIFGAREFRKLRRSENWPSVRGTVEESSIQLSEDCSPIPSIRYKYYVNGIPFHCDRIHFELRKLDQESATMFVAKYPIGQKVNVHYDPKDVETAVLEPGVSMKTGVVGLVVILAFHLAGWCIFCIAILRANSAG